MSDLYYELRVIRVLPGNNVSMYVVYTSAAVPLHHPDCVICSIVSDHTCPGGIRGEDQRTAAGRPEKGIRRDNRLPEVAGKRGVTGALC